MKIDNNCQGAVVPQTEYEGDVDLVAGQLVANDGAAELILSVRDSQQRQIYQGKVALEVLLRRRYNN